MTRNTSSISRFSNLWLLLLSLSACATSRPAADVPATPSSDSKVVDLKKQLETLQNQLQGVEVKLSALNDKLDATRTSVETIHKTQAPESNIQEVTPSAVDRSTPISAVAPTPVKKVTPDPESGFLSDAAVLTYRKAMALYDSSKFPEAVLGFTQFLDQYADHPWAGSAQYFIGMSYVSQKECKLAVQEFGRVLTSYDRSPHVPDSLRELVKCEEDLKLSKQASQHRQMLLSLYPNSPAAREARERNPTPVSAPSSVSSPATAPVPAGVKEESDSS